MCVWQYQQNLLLHNVTSYVHPRGLLPPPPPFSKLTSLSIFALSAADITGVAPALHMIRKAHTDCDLLYSTYDVLIIHVRQYVPIRRQSYISQNTRVHTHTHIHISLAVRGYVTPSTTACADDVRHHILLFGTLPAPVPRRPTVTTPEGKEQNILLRPMELHNVSNAKETTQVHPATEHQHDMHTNAHPLLCTKTSTPGTHSITLTSRHQ